MGDLASTLGAACADAFESIGLDRKWGAVRRSDRPELADFQCNGAMGAAKSAGRVPRDVAAEVAAHLAGHEAIASCEVAGPGFLNIRVTDAALAARAEAVRSEAMAGAEKVADAERVLLDFGGPNVAKPMHVGHLRSAVIGDTLQRVLRFLGDDTISDTHLGDWGLQMGHLVTELYDERPDLIYFDAAYEGPYPEEPPVTIDDLGRLYPQASAKAKADEARNLRSQEAVAELQAGRPGYRALLKHFINVSVAALKEDYAFLNVSFDLWKGESDVDHLIPRLIEDFKAKGLAKEDDGAVIVDVAREGENVPVEGKDGKVKLKNAMPPIMLVNSRGGTGYHTTDLATILDRTDGVEWKDGTIAPPARMLYVVDQRQALHFEQVFRAADLAGLFPADRLEHIGFGTVNGPDGKPFKTREGGVLRLSDLNSQTMEAVRSKLFRQDSETGTVVLHEGYKFALWEHFPRLRELSLHDKIDLTDSLLRRCTELVTEETEGDLSNSLFSHLISETTESFQSSRLNMIESKDLDKVDSYLAKSITLWGRDASKLSDDFSHPQLISDVVAFVETNYVQPISVAAIRFADLQNTRTTNYIFDLDRFTSFEGKTGPYLLYAAVRIKSLLRRAAEEGHAPGAIRVESEAERALVLALDGFGRALIGTREKRMPHILCEHVYTLAQAFSAFYGAHPIAAEKDADTRASRLGLCEAVLTQLETGLDLLGIRVPDRM